MTGNSTPNANSSGKKKLTRSDAERLRQRQQLDRREQMMRRRDAQKRSMIDSQNEPAEINDHVNTTARQRTESVNAHVNGNDRSIHTTGEEALGRKPEDEVRPDEHVIGVAPDATPTALGNDVEQLPHIENVPSSDKPKSKMSLVKRSRVVYENDLKAIQKRFIPSHIRAGIFYAICVAVLIVSGWQLVQYVIETFGAEEEFQEVVDTYVLPDPIPVEQQDPDTSAWPPIVDFAALQADNPDVAGWIRIPGTSVDYPVMTNPENDYYLHRDMNGRYSLPGAIFADYQNNHDLSQDNHIVVYGHHMVTPTMFHDVANFANKQYFEDHRVIYLETPETTYVCKAVAMYVVHPTEYETRKVIFEDSQTFQQYMDSRLERSDYISFDDYTRSTADKLVTLITCNNTGSDRQVVECIIEQEYPTSMIPQVIATALAERQAQEQ